MPVVTSLLFALTLLFAALAPQDARAGISLCTPGVCTCTVSTTGILLSGYDPLDGNTATGTGSVTTSCQMPLALGLVQVPYTVSLSKGMSTGYSPRKLQGHSNSGTLNYNLYMDAGMSTIWGDGTGSTQLLSSAIKLTLPNTGVTEVDTIYALIPAGQNAATGFYSDTITATLSF